MKETGLISLRKYCVRVQVLVLSLGHVLLSIVGPLFLLSSFVVSPSACCVIAPFISTVAVIISLF